MNHYLLSTERSNVLAFTKLTKVTTPPARFHLHPVRLLQILHFLATVNNSYTYILDLHSFVVWSIVQGCSTEYEQKGSRKSKWYPENISAVYSSFRIIFNDSQAVTGMEPVTWLNSYTTTKLTILHKMYETIAPSERGVTLWLVCLIGTQLPDYILFSATAI